jgi:hypothetical protein
MFTFELSGMDAERALLDFEVTKPSLTDPMFSHFHHIN